MGEERTENVVRVVNNRREQPVTIRSEVGGHEVRGHEVRGR